MQDLLRDIDTLETRQQIELHFALGKACEDLGRHAEAFAHWRDGNAIKRRVLDYSESGMLAWLARIRDVFTPELMRAKAELGDPSELPVFIVGMPRSGTTLLEQILSGHPDFFGAGELHNFGRAVTGLAPGALAFPEAVWSWDADALMRLGARYDAELRALAPRARRASDKLPANFQFCGLIHLALPHARIIHVRRDPVDTCLSCFSKLFTGDNLPYAYDLEAELGRYYRAYAEPHGATGVRCSPAGVMLEVAYEDMVGDLEGQARKAVAHCGLDWDPRCLAFHDLDRPVRTASAAQVRQPLYGGSVARGRNYDGMLQPLLEALR